MEKAKDITNRQVVKQSNSISTAKYKLTATEVKFIALAVAQISREDTNFNTYSIKVSDIEEFTHAKQDKDKLIKKFAFNLLSKPFQVATNTGWIVFNWFSSIEYKRGEARIECRVDDKLKPYLLELQGHFTKYQLGNIAQMRSVYAIRIYQMLNQYDVKLRGRFITDLQALQEQLQVPKSLKLYNQFKEKVVNVAVKEINEKTDIEIKFYEDKKIRKKVISIGFEIRNKTDKELEHIRELQQPKLPTL